MTSQQYESDTKQRSDSDQTQSDQTTRPQASYDSKFLEQVFGGSQNRSDAVMQVLAHFDQMEQQARTARQTVWGLSLILRENTTAIISALPPIVASQVADELRRQFPGLSKQH